MNSVTLLKKYFTYSLLLEVGFYFHLTINFIIVSILSVSYELKHLSIIWAVIFIIFIFARSLQDMKREAN